MTASSPGAVIDPLDSLDNFGTPLNADLTLIPGGQVSLTATQASVDRLVDWQNGNVRLDLAMEGQLTVTPSQQIGNGEWGLWAVYSTAAGDFVGENEMLSFTSSITPVTLDVNDFAPSGGLTSEEYVLRFRVREAVGDGFAFTEIRAVPEPGTFLAGALGLLVCLRLRSRR